MHHQTSQQGSAKRMNTVMPYHLMLFSSFIPNAALSASNTKSLQQKDFQHLWCKEKKSNITRTTTPPGSHTGSSMHAAAVDRTKTFFVYFAVAQNH